MLTSVRSLMAATVLAGVAFTATPALAQDLGLSVSGNAAVVSEYRYRGVDMSGGDVAIQGGVDATHDSGVYAGVWGSSLDEDSIGLGHTELNLYGGWSGTVASGVTADAGVVYYLFPNAHGDSDYVEFYGSLGFGIGPAHLTGGVAYAPEQDALGDQDNLYLYTDLGVGIPNTPVTILAHAGYTDGALTFTNDGDAWDYSIGANVALTQNLTVGAAYVGVDGSVPAGAYDLTDDALVATLTVGF